MHIGLRVVKTMTYPFTWFALATVVAGEWVFMDWFRPPFLMSALALALGAGLLALWSLFINQSAHFHAHLYDLPDQAGPRDPAHLDRLRTNLQSVRSQQGMEQLQLLGEKLETVQSVLKSRLNAGELTFGRYIATAEQVYLNGIDHLRDVHVSLTSVATIDQERIDGRLVELNRDPLLGEAQAREMTSLKERKNLRKRQLEKVSHLLADNEELLTALDNVATSLADARIGKGHATMTANEALNELARLADSANKYEG